MTDMAWPARMPTNTASLYLQEAHGIPAQPKTLRNWRSLGRGPKCRYFGTLPLYDRPELDRFAQEDALSDKSPIAGRRVAREAA